MNEMTIDLEGCARCDGEGHEGLTFHEFTRAVDGRYTYWAMCPTLNEPILMEIVEREADS